jgi:hypothetical protein
VAKLIPDFEKCKFLEIDSIYSGESYSELIYILIQTIDIEVKKAKIKRPPVKSGLNKIKMKKDHLPVKVQQFTCHSFITNS